MKIRKKNTDRAPGAKQHSIKAVDQNHINPGTVPVVENQGRLSSADSQKAATPEKHPSTTEKTGTIVDAIFKSTIKRE